MLQIVHDLSVAPVPEFYGAVGTGTGDEVIVRAENHRPGIVIMGGECKVLA